MPKVEIDVPTGTDLLVAIDRECKDVYVWQVSISGSSGQVSKAEEFNQKPPGKLEKDKKLTFERYDPDRAAVSAAAQSLALDEPEDLAGTTYVCVKKSSGRWECKPVPS